MGLFWKNFNSPGPGIPKELPKKKGMALLTSTFKREIGNLITLNLLFILFSIPIVTIGPAYAAMTKVTTKMLNDENVYVFADFLQAFKNNWKQALPVWLVSAFLFLVFRYNYLFYLAKPMDGTLYLAVFMLTTAFALVFALSLVHIYSLVVNVELKLKDVFRNAFLLGMGCLKCSVPCALICGAMFFIFYWYLALLPVALIIGFSSINLIASFAAWPGIKKYVLAQPDSLPQIDAK